MKIVVRFKQKVDALGVHILYRIIDLTPDKRFFKRKIEDRIISTFKNSKIKYCKRVEEILSMNESEMRKWIMPDIKEHLANPGYLSKKAREFEMEIKIER